MSLYIHKKMFMHFGQDAALAFSEMVHRRNPDFNKFFARNSEPVLSFMTGVSKHDRDGTSMGYSLFLFFW